MRRKKEQPITNPDRLTQAYKNGSSLDKRKALYEYTQPRYVVEDEVIRLLDMDVNKSLLDVGCGSGRLLLKLSEMYPNSHLVGVDISSGIFAEAEKKVRLTKMPIDFQVGDVQDLRFKDGSFDRITALHMIYHVPDILTALSELRRVISPHGFVLLTVNSLHSKPTLRKIKAEVATLLGMAEYPDTTLRFNLENGPETLRHSFPKVETIAFESKLRLTDSQPYVDYFDSTREFWDPLPGEDSWQTVLALVRSRIDHDIALRGYFEEVNQFAILMAFP